MQRLLGLAALAVCAAAGGAEASPLYEMQDGLWGRDGCAASDAYFYASEDLYLNLYKQDGEWLALLSKPVSQRVTATHIVEQYKYGDTYYLYYSWFAGGGLLSASSPEPASAEQDIESVPDLPPADYDVQHYERCARLPADVYFTHAEGATFMELVTAMRRACADGEQACIDHGFAAVDVSNDRRLSVAEISRMLRILTYAAVAANPDGAKEQNVAGALALMSLFGPLVASAVVAGSDYDADGQLAMNELFHDRDVATVRQALESMSFDQVGSTMSAIFQGMAGLPGLF